MRRVLSLWFPTFSTDLLKRRQQARSVTSGERQTRDGFVLLTRRVGSRELVVRRCERCERAGIRPGMDLAQARSLLPAGAGLVAAPHRPDLETQALEAVARRALRFSPLVATDPPDGLLIDVTGTERLHKGEVRLIRAAEAFAGGLNLRSRVAAASTFACAWGVARFGAHALSRVPSGREREALSRLPVAALKIDEETIRGLHEIGITGVGHVLDLPREAIAARFASVLLDRIARALGETFEYIEPVRPIPPVRAELVFDGPTDRWESVDGAARRVLEDLSDELMRRQRGVRRLRIDLLRPRAAPESLEIALSQPSASLRHLWSLVRPRLDRVDLGEGVEGVVMVALRTGPLRHEQLVKKEFGGVPDADAAAPWGELVDTLIGRLGSENVVRIEPVESHLPERAFRERSVLEDAPGGEPAAISIADRPTLLFPRPEPANVMALTPDGPVLSLTWRGECRRVSLCVGPERLSPEWWRWHERIPPDRDYFAVQTEEGRWLWLCRQVGSGRWFVHGRWA